MVNKKSRFTRIGIQAALVWHSVRTVARAPPWKYVTNAVAVREAPRTWRGFRLSRRTIIGVRQIALTFRCPMSMCKSRRRGRKNGRRISSCGSAQSRIEELTPCAKPNNDPESKEARPRWQPSPPCHRNDKAQDGSAVRRPRRTNKPSFAGASAHH